MAVKNPWVGYLDRSYQQIKSKILIRLGETIPEISDHSDSNILVVVIEAFAGVSEQLNYYIDNMAREAFITTARRYSSVVKHTRLIDYRIKAIVPASVDITLEFRTMADAPLALPAQKIIPSGTKFTTSNGIEFITTEDKVVLAGVTSIDLSARQKTIVVNDIIGETNNNPEQVISLGKEYVHNSVSLFIGNDPWLLVDTLGFSGPLDRHYIVDISANQEAYIKFGDGINGAVPITGLSVVATYYTSKGILGNINTNTLTLVSIPLHTLLGIPKVIFSNKNKAIGGTNYEDIDRIRRSAPLSLRTLGRAVSFQDHIDIALLAPGVDKAQVQFDCNKSIYIYVSPNGGGIASTGFLKDLVTYFENKKMIGTFIKPLPCGESQIVLDLEVMGKFRADGPKLRSDIVKLLTESYSYKNSDINKPIRVSDLIALVDNHVNVSYLTLKSLYLKPYLRPIGLLSDTVPLNYDISLNIGSVSTLNWKVKYDGANMILFKNDTPVGNLIIGTTFTDPFNILTLKINPGPYVMGMEWEFKSLPFNMDLILTDYSIPIINEENITLIVNEQLSL